MSRYLSRHRSRERDSILEAGLDERGEAPPPYGVAERDRPPGIGEVTSEQMAIEQWRAEVPPVTDPTATESMTTVTMVELPVETVGSLLQPPGYDERELAGHSARTGTNMDMGMPSPRRPPTAVIATERFSGVDLGDNTHTRERDDDREQRTRISGGAPYWGSWRSQ